MSAVDDNLNYQLDELSVKLLTYATYLVPNIMNWAHSIQTNTGGKKTLGNVLRTCPSVKEFHAALMDASVAIQNRCSTPKLH